MIIKSFELRPAVIANCASGFYWVQEANMARLKGDLTCGALLFCGGIKSYVADWGSSSSKIQEGLSWISIFPGIIYHDLLP